MFGVKKKTESEMANQIGVIVRYTLRPYPRSHVKDLKESKTLASESNPRPTFYAFLIVREQKKGEWYSDYLANVIIPELSKLESLAIDKVSDVRLADSL